MIVLMEAGRRWAKIALSIVAVLVVVGAGWTIKNRLTDLKTQTVANAGYTYTFNFYRGAYPVRLEDGTNALEADGVTVGIQTTDSPPVSQCPQIGEGWVDAFKVQINGADTQVCTAAHIGFIAVVDALGKHHMMSVTYKKQQTDKVYPTLQKIYGSLKISQ